MAAPEMPPPELFEKEIGATVVSDESGGDSDDDSGSDDSTAANVDEGPREDVAKGRKEPKEEGAKGRSQSLIATVFFSSLDILPSST
jgi:hypothetical protein